MQSMRQELDANESDKRMNDVNSRKLVAVEESIKQIMEFCVKVIY